MERTEQEIEEMLGWAQSSPEEAGREIMRLEDKIVSLESALKIIRDGGCQNFTSGLGSCYRNGRTETAADGADKCCDACIADRALAEH